MNEYERKVCYTDASDASVASVYLREFLVMHIMYDVCDAYDACYIYTNEV